MLYEHEHWIYYINCVTLYGQGAVSSDKRKTIFWCGAPSSSNSGPYMHEERSVGGRGGWNWACKCKMTQACMHGTHLRDVAEPRIGQGQGAVRGQAGGTRAGSAGDWNLIIVVRREVGRVQGARSGGPESGGEVDGWMDGGGSMEDKMWVKARSAGGQTCMPGLARRARCDTTHLA